MNISATSELHFNDYIKYTTNEQYEKDYAQYLKEFEAFSQKKEELSSTIKTPSDLDFDSIQYFKASELKEMFPTKEEQDKAYFLKRVSDFSNDDELNKILFEQASTLQTPQDLSNMLVILNYEKNYTKNREFDFPSEVNLRPYYNEDDPLESEFNFEDKGKVVEFLDKLIYHLDRGQKNDISNAFSMQFKDIRQEYKKDIDENEALLDQMTKYMKPQTLEESQRQKDEEQIALAMEFHGLDPNEDFHRFAFGIMQQGFSKDEALERTNVYSSLGLISRASDIRKFGIEEVITSVGYLDRDPVLKDTMMEAFAQMDTDQLKKVGYDMGFHAGFSVDISKIIGKGENVSREEILRRVDRHWEETYGTTQQLLTMFNERLEYYIDLEKKKIEKVDYIIEAYNLFIDTLIKNKNEANSID